MHLPDGAPSRENVFVAARRLQRRRPPPVAKTSPGRGKMAKPKRGIQGEAVGAVASKTWVPFKARNECWVPQLVDKSRI